MRTRCEHTRLIAMGLLDTTGRGRSFTSSLGCELLTRGLATSGFTYERSHVNNDLLADIYEWK